jgi:hypothetical protein
LTGKQSGRKKQEAIQGKPLNNSLSLTTKLPDYHICLGLAFYFVGLMAKENLPQTIGSLPVIQLPVAFFSSTLIPLGSLLALRAILLQGSCHQKLMGFHLLGLIFVFLNLSWYFSTYIISQKIVNIPNFQTNSILPKLVENARTLSTEQKRKFQAQWAYRLYGSVIAYRLDNMDVAYYTPSEEDKIFWRQQQRTEQQVGSSIDFLKKIANQLPYLFGLYAATSMATFVAGGAWLALITKKSPTV